MSALLQTKLIVPPVREILVVRDRLLLSLDALLLPSRRLGLVAAPAGYGKTTLVSAWASDRSLPVGWVSLDAGDNDPVRFFSYVIAAVQRAVAELGVQDVGEAAQNALSSPQASLTKVLQLLVNDLVRVQSSQAVTPPMLLVLDDYHEIETASVHEGIAFLLDNLPPMLRLLLLTRADPLFPLSRFRARNQIVELRGSDLAFEPKEVAQFLNDVMGLSLTPETVTELETRTEGWITGLQMAALSLKHHQDPVAFVTQLSGTDRYILDYLVEEVLMGQPAEVQAFLLRTSILERLTASLCKAVWGAEEGTTYIGDAICDPGDAQCFLMHLERGNLFLVPLDSERRWYRYHRLFVDLLRARAKQVLGEAIDVLHLRASHWYEQHGSLDDAVHHALQAGDTMRLARLLSAHGMALLRHGRLNLLLRWLAALPDVIIADCARLSAIQAWAYLLTGQVQAAIASVEQAEVALARQPDSDMRGQTAAIRAYLAQQHSDSGQAEAAAQRALVELDEENWAIRAIMHFVLGGAALMRGDFRAASEAMARAAVQGERGDNPNLALSATNALVELTRAIGQLDRAESMAHTALARITGSSGKPLPIAGGVVSALAEIAYERNELNEALAYANEALELSQQWGSRETTIHNYFTLARALLALGRLDDAAEALRAAVHLCDVVVGTPIREAYLQAALGRFWLARRDVIGATTWLASVPNPESLSTTLDQALVLVEVHLWLGHLDEARALLTQVLAAAEARGLVPAKIEALALQARLYQTERATDQALAALRSAIRLALPQGFIRRILDRGPGLLPLLAQVANSERDPAVVKFVQGLLLQTDEGVQGVPFAIVHDEFSHSLLEPLSERELEVLGLVAAGLTNREVAQRLFVVESTVKSHLNSTYQKLGVRNRTEAVARARALDLIPD